MSKHNMLLVKLVVTVNDCSSLDFFLMAIDF